MSIGSLHKSISRPPYAIRAFAGALLFLAAGFYGISHLERVSAQSAALALGPTKFRIGEKLSYNVSFGKIPNAGYVETYVVSRGRLSGKDAIELRSKIKTQELVSAAFFLIDESRTVYAAPDTGLPLYVSTNIHASALPKDTISNYLTQPTTYFDLLTLIYKARESGGAGSFPLFENDQLYTATFQPTVAEHIKNAVGEFDTVVSTVQSDFLTANGIKDARINFTSDEDHVPILIRFKTSKGEFRATIAGIVLPDPEPVGTPTPTPSPSPVASASPKITPKPSPTPPVYVENQPLLPELGFGIGEVLTYRISSAGKPVAAITLNVKERKLFKREDSLLLTATVTSVEPETTAFRLGDSASAQVDPDTLAPKSMESNFSSAFPGLNQTLTVNKNNGEITFGPKQVIDSPIGTHTYLSLIYAMRSFNLKPSKDPNNPVNDTRVAVFWESKPLIFTLRPSNPAEITVNGEKVSAQLITINTSNTKLDDVLGLKVWLSTEERVPLRFSFGPFQAELTSKTSNLTN